MSDDFTISEFTGNHVKSLELLCDSLAENTLLQEEEQPGGTILGTGMTFFNRVVNRDPSSLYSRFAQRKPCPNLENLRIEKPSKDNFSQQLTIQKYNDTLGLGIGEDGCSPISGKEFPGG